MFKYCANFKQQPIVLSILPVNPGRELCSLTPIAGGNKPPLIWNDLYHR